MHTISRPAALALLLVVGPACTGRSDPAPAPPLGIQLVDPSPGAFAGSRLTVQVAVEGTPDAVELWRDGTLAASLGALRRIDLDTAPVPEGTHRLVARARLGERVAESAAVEFTVDHTPPVVLSRSPLLDAPEGWDGAVTLQVSEPVTAVVRPGNPLLQGDASQPLDGTLTVSPSGTEVRIDVLNLAVTFTDAVNVTQPDLVDRAGNVAERLDWGFWLPPLQPVMVSPPPSGSLLAGARARLEARVVGIPVGRVEFQVAGAVHPASGGPTWSVDLDTSSLPDGTYPVTAVAHRGSRAITSAGAELVVDHTPPTLSSSTPADGDVEVARLAEVVLTFSEPVAPASLPAAVTVGGDCGIAGPGTLRSPDTLVLAPGGGTGCADTVSVSTALTDLAGNPLAAPVVLRVERPFWRRTPLLGGATPSLVASAVDAQGRLAIAWYDGTLTGPDASGAGRLAGDAWQPLPAPSAALGEGTVFVGGLAAAGGDALVLAAGLQTPGGRVELHVLGLDGAAWSPLGGPLNVDPDRSVDVFALPDVAPDRHGGLWLAWTEATAPVYSTSAYVRHFDGAAWGTVLPLDTPGAQAVGARVSSGPEGTVALTWWTDVFDAGGLHREVQAARLEGGALVPLASPAPGVDGICPQVAVDGAGAIHVAWLERNPGDAIRVARWSGTAWVPLGGALNAHPGDPVACPVLVAEGPDRLLVAYSEIGASGLYELRAHRWDGSGWVALPAPAQRDPNPDTIVYSAAAAPGFPAAIVAPEGYAGGLTVHRENR